MLPATDNPGCKASQTPWWNISGGSILKDELVKIWAQPSLFHFPILTWRCPCGCINPPITPNTEWRFPLGCVDIPGINVWYGRLQGPRQLGWLLSSIKLWPLWRSIIMVLYWWHTLGLVSQMMACDGWINPTYSAMWTHSLLVQSLFQSLCNCSLWTSTHCHRYQPHWNTLCHSPQQLIVKLRDPQSQCSGLLPVQVNDEQKHIELGFLNDGGVENLKYWS